MAAILLVDDEIDSRDALARYLRRAGHLVHCASNGKQALTSLFANSPDVVILDARMPEMDGIGFLEVIRCYLRWQHLPVILLTAYPEGHYLRRVRDLEVRKIFLKTTCDVRDLLQEVEACAASPLATPPSLETGWGESPVV